MTQILSALLNFLFMSVKCREAAIMSLLLCSLFVLCFSIVVFKLFLIFKRILWKRKNKNCLSIGFFHPYCNAGGGGERVLWAAVRAIQKQFKDMQCVIYSGDDVNDDEVINNVQLRFNIKLIRDVKIIHLRSRGFVEAKYYPYFTLLLQSMGSMVLGFEALSNFVPDIYIDTMGYAFTLPLFKVLGSCKVGCYVHYPTISTDMLKVVESRTIAVNNRRFISNSKFFSQLKLIYYKLFAFIYGAVGRYSELIMVNSSWTNGHILNLWHKPEATCIVYPPCDVTEFNNIPLERHKNEKRMRIVSIAQFRPEKNHQLQLKSFHELLKRLGNVPYPPQLVLIGSCRHDEDYERVKRLKDMCNDLGISANVEFKINVTFQDLLNEMTKSSVALHTMTNEHFGIGVVECMSAGLITIAHDSGGPKMDIISTAENQRTGFLANDVITYADALEKVFKTGYDDLYKIRSAARESVDRFSDEKYEETFLYIFKLLCV
ncbi:GDP-Man:Man(3)GlcNAc(2)-PP-Dol alpha-1,2-mannosyltransferase isoform X1 [Parasteatoda tepidariorum]|uniref:GDP-Man:Man(3)GlcNAc(2)-PP-Dol alpha-1,2-mannosyltransferase isoform X1 n=2 Tax=Parasteatoda tepidariorum TaxID=114398 RepID=UPI0039BCFAA1